MSTRITTLIRTSITNIPGLALLSALIVAAPVVALSNNSQASHAHTAPAKLVRIVRENTRQFIDVSAATSAGYGPFLGCVSGPDHGAMGVHYINLALYGDGEIDASRPEALIYEPDEIQMRLVGVEYIVDAQTWLNNHNNTPPVLEGASFPVRRKSKPLQPAFVLRAARLGLARQPSGCVRGLEQSSEL